MEYLATFPNQLQAMEYARALTRSGIPSRMMPRPRALEASCGTAVRFSSRQPVDILLTLAPVKTLYRWSRAATGRSAKKQKGGVYPANRGASPLVGLPCG